MAEEQLKQCIDCKEFKTLDCFHKSHSNKFGVNSRCKICRSIFTQTPEQKEKKKKYNSEYSKRETSIIREKNRNRIEYYREFEKSEHRKEYMKKRRESGEYQKYHAEYRKTEKAKIASKLKHHKRRAIKKDSTITSIEILKLQQNAKKCYWCGCSLKNVNVHIDHYIPLSKGGEHILSNLVISCDKCNLNKHAKDPIEFAHSIGRLL